MCAIRSLPVLSLFALTGCAHLQGPSRPASPIEPGQRIRITVPSAHPTRRVGTLVSLTVDSVALAEDTGRTGAATARVAFPVAAVTKVEVSTGVRGHAPQGVVDGGKVGLIVVLLGFAAGQWAPGDAESIAVFCGGLVVGGVIGAAVVTEDWRRVPLQSLRAGASPRP